LGTQRKRDENEVMGAITGRTGLAVAVTAKTAQPGGRSVSDRLMVSMMGKPTPGVIGPGTRCLHVAVPGRAVRCPAAESDDSVKTGRSRKVLR